MVSLPDECQMRNTTSSVTSLNAVCVTITCGYGKNKAYGRLLNKWRNKLKIFLTTIVVLALIGLVGCSKTDGYTPPANATGEEIFNMNCTGCHKPLSDGIMALSESSTSKSAIINKVQNGSMRMTAFPNIQGEPADRLADYVLKNSRPK